MNFLVLWSIGALAIRTELPDQREAEDLAEDVAQIEHVKTEVRLPDGELISEFWP